MICIQVFKLGSGVGWFFPPPPPIPNQTHTKPTNYAISTRCYPAKNGKIATHCRRTNVEHG